ncbi:2-dehydropantoate 2-reductase [Metschnikowia bicuspidata var. bicuspidata NRRL YB-4993]|uniref:2-dehydropantoate 2-reductase n=1 Tax=Metschnikowia bicuspidata var. bicuspidata NRRL YB-4993 TaxID=869754 RepID=A0A1A0HKX9_9ASCO|nr:2-dehydropantoate 2-reductase [Metschnikowia bicuspidata var. bicuspidata NRRL YB-4993]OBA24463.1 2-dehydropantoate 2-reductase [Metschnikowia bicuspidata var. bicuspidata NRRL YB-4993]
MIPKVLVVGSGGVGSIAALSLTINGKSETTLVVRSDYDKVIKDGYTVHSVTYGNLEHWRPKNVARSVEDAARDFGPFDYVVVTTKNIPDGSMTCEDIIRPAISSSTTIVLIQNGIGIEIPMIEQFPGSVVLSGISLIGSSNIDCVIENLHKDHILLSPFNNPNVPKEVADEKLKEFAAIYQNDDKSVNEIDLEEDSRRSRWAKLVYNAVMNTTCAITGIDVNRCQINGANKALFEPAMNEVLAIAASDGVQLGDDSKQKFLHIGDGLFYSPSMLIDVQKNQLVELEIILGNPLKIARKNGIETPVLSVMYQLLKMKQFKIREDKGLVQVDETKFRGKNSDEYPEIFAATNHRN